jgi:hypothetical protein
MDNAISSEHLINRLGAPFIPNLFKPASHQGFVFFRHNYLLNNVLVI